MTQWLTTLKPTFQAKWLALPPKQAKQILQKIHLLAEDPTPDAKVKKQLKHWDGKLHRLRCGDYRILYTFEEPYISLLDLRRRDDSTYDSLIESENLGGFAPGISADNRQQPSWAEPTPAESSTATELPEPITVVLLERLRVPAQFHDRLISVRTQEDLLDVDGVPDDHLLRIDAALFDRGLAEVADQPDLVAQDIDDLIRFKEGDLAGFLLRLNPEQEKFVSWGMNASGPTLVKGAPGTGKSTIALYRVRSYIDALRADGTPKPRILFTTYTNALVAFSRSLLDSLLGEDADLVDVRTADGIVRDVLTQADLAFRPADGATCIKALESARKGLRPTGSALEQRKAKAALERMTDEYLLEEICSVIHGRGLAREDEYLAASRAGREVPLTQSQRKLVWALKDRFEGELADAGLATWQALRGRAAAELRESEDSEYDAVLVDEAQDLDPVALRTLIGVCKAPNRVMLTADANQSIYGSGFRWKEVHDWLRFKGRTGILRANHRSTREIAEAARDYLSHGVLDADEEAPRFVHSGPMPVVREVASAAEEAELIERFVRSAARELRLGTSACAVLAPSARAATSIAECLHDRGLPATFMKSRELDLSQKGVKVLVLKSAKGLEFPIVVLAGFFAPYPHFRGQPENAERLEVMRRERRTVFVGMTRAMRALMVVRPRGEKAALLDAFAPELWNVG